MPDFNLGVKEGADGGVLYRSGASMCVEDKDKNRTRVGIILQLGGRILKKGDKLRSFQVVSVGVGKPLIVEKIS